MTTVTLEGPSVDSPGGSPFTGFAPSEEWYLESSALVKLVIEEERSHALRDWLRELEERGGAVFASDLGRTEAYRAVVRAAPELAREVGPLVDDLARVEVSERDFVQARVLQPPSMRTLDALHLAVVLGHDGRPAGIVTYDQRIIEAAAMLGIRTATP
jgi:predicted nucleic acid-binding protein